LNRVGRKLLLHLLLICFMFSLVSNPVCRVTSSDCYNSLLGQNHSDSISISLAEDSIPVFEDDFNSSTGFNESLWNLESYGNGSVSWIDGNYFNMSAKLHSYRALTSTQTFDVGHEVSFRMRMQEGDTVVCIGWTNTTPSEWNYLFWNDSVYIEAALDTLLLTHKFFEPPKRTFKQLSGIDASEFHTYRIVWNSSAIIAYVDGIRYSAVGGAMPSGPLHFKIAITENHNIDTEGWVCIDSVIIKEHHSMIQENPPFISLNSPGNNTRNLGNALIDIVPIGSNGTLCWSWDGTDNNTGSFPYDIHLPTTEGQHYLDVYCKDGYGYDNWDHVRYLFQTMVTPPLFFAEWLSTSPVIDGVIQPGEWPSTSLHNIVLVRADGSSVSVDISIGCDRDFFYVAFNSSIPAGHDSRASIIINGNPDGMFHGINVTPITTVYYTKGSPGAWEGYDELHILSEADDVVVDQKLEAIPSGFIAVSSEQMNNVHYEFRVPLDELSVAHGARIGISFMLFPTGMGVHNLYFPIANPWENASKLALVQLPLVPDTTLTQLGFFIVLSLAGIALVIGWTMRARSSKNRKVTLATSTVSTSQEKSEIIQRILSIIESYNEITIERLALMANISEDEARETVSQLISEGKLRVKLIDNKIFRSG
jgi:predicted transcriptional regulator